MNCQASTRGRRCRNVASWRSDQTGYLYCTGHLHRRARHLPRALSFTHLRTGERRRSRDFLKETT